MERFRSTFFPIFIFILAFAVRFIFISKGPYHIDCLNLTLKSQDTLQTAYLRYLFGSGYPLLVLLGALFVGLFHLIGIVDPVMAVNFMSVVFGALGAWMFFHAARRLLDERAACAGSLIFCVSPILWTSSTYGMGHAPSVFFLLMSVYFLSAHAEQTTRRELLLAALAMGLMAATRLQDAVLMAVPIGFWLLSGSRTLKERARDFLLFFAASAAIAILFHLPYWGGPTHSGYEHQWNTYWKLGVTINVRGWWSAYLKVSFFYLVRSFGVVGLCVALGGWLWMARRQTRLAIFIALWILVPFMFYGNLSTTVPRFFGVMIAAVVLCQAYLLARCLSAGKICRWLAIIFIVLAMFRSLTVSFPMEYYRHTYARIVDYGRWFARYTEKNAVIITGDEDRFIEYYGQRSVLERPFCQAACAGEFETLKRKIDAFLDSGRPVYITDVGLYVDNPTGEWGRFMSANYDIRYVDEVLMEDWHKGCLYLRILPTKIFGVSRRGRP